MPNPQISFRLSHHQIAQGLKLLRSIDPSITPSSISQIIKIFYLHIIHEESPKITPAEINEITSLISTRKSPINFTDFQSALTHKGA